MIRGTAANNTSLIVNSFVIDRRNKQIRESKIMKIFASNFVISPAAIGLSFVLKTFPSMSLSKKSLIAQPKDLVKKEPKRTITKCEISKPG